MIQVVGGKDMDQGFIQWWYLVATNARLYYRTQGPHAIPHGVMHTTCSSTHKGADTGPAAELLPFYNPVQFCWFNGCFPVILVPANPSFNCMYKCAILEYMDYLCNLIDLQVMPLATVFVIIKSITQILVRIGQEEFVACSFPFRGRLAFASLLHLLSFSFAPKKKTD